jgi:hypothetical protein
MPLEDPEGETETRNSITTSYKSLEISFVCFNLIDIALFCIILLNLCLVSIFIKF